MEVLFLEFGWNGGLLFFEGDFLQEAKKRGLKFLLFTIIPTFAFPKKTVDQCDVRVWG